MVKPGMNVPSAITLATKKLRPQEVKGFAEGT